MSISENNQHTPQEIDAQVQTLLGEMHALLNRSKISPSAEVSQELVECFLKMESLQQQIKNQLSNLSSEE